MSEERDREIDAAWRTAGREEPPAALDDAIRAEARRAVGAGPSEARRRRLRQLRYPFAAAATVALLAFGIAEMTPPDEVAPSAVSDQSAAARAREGAEKAFAPPPAPATVASSPHEPAPGAKPPQSSTGNAAPPPGAPAQAPLRSAATKRAQTSSTEQEAKNEASRKESGERFAAAPPPTEPSSATRPQAQAGPPPAGASTAKLAQNEPPRTDAAAGKPAQNVPPSPAADARRDIYARTPAQPAAATAVGEIRNRAAPATASNLDELKARDAGAESVEAWIARIRELKASGQADALAKELAKFRTTFGERADSLLPSDLRSLAASRP
jgi:hypothetical protein